MFWRERRTLPAQGSRHQWGQRATTPFGDGGAGAEHKAEQTAFEATCIASNNFSVSIPMPVVDNSKNNDDQNVLYHDKNIGMLRILASYHARADE